MHVWSSSRIVKAIEDFVVKKLAFRAAEVCFLKPLATAKPVC